jgi:hypothetical protein
VGLKFDPSGMFRAFDKMSQTANEKGKDLAKDQGKFFLGMTRKISWQEAPSKELFDQLLSRLGGRLKRKPGVRPAKEIQRRKRMRGMFARRWAIHKVENSGYRIRVWIGNPVSYADKAEAKHEPAVQAANIVGRAFNRRLNRLAQQVTGVF